MGLLIKLAFDQIFFAPPMIAIMLSSIELLKLNGLSAVNRQLSTNFWDVLIVNYTMWPALTIFHMFFIPLKFKRFFLNIFSIIWYSYVSWKAHKVDKIEE